jgi:glycine/D-amino acid oxidase-like deaminating enzyme
MHIFDYDYLIIGQGIAGTSLAMQLTDLGQKILIVNDPALPSSSKVAAGIFNPLTGKKLVKTWLADDIFPYAHHFYSSLEEKLNSKFVHDVSIYRPFRSIEEQNTYLAQTADPAIEPYIKSSGPKADVSQYVHAEHEGLEVTKSGWVDLPLLLKKGEDFFRINNCYSEASFDLNEIEIFEKYIGWKGKTFGKIVLCQGFEALRNTLFNWLPFAPVKGQILEVATEKVLKPYIINQGIFILPTSEATCRVGATYSWENLDWEITAEARNELETKFEMLFKKEYRVVGQSAGIRPSSNDRRPMIGVHPEHSNVFILNGLGTKGVTLAPFF